MKFLSALVLGLLMAVSVQATQATRGEPSCLAACSFGDAGWYHLACLKNADVGTLIRQYNCYFADENENRVSCEEIAGSEVRDATEGPVAEATKQFYAWCGKNNLFPR